MKKSTKAVLLSALVFPGLGHLYLKKYPLGVVLAGASFAAIYLLFAKALELADAISARILSGDVQLNLAAISELASQLSNDADARMLNLASTGIFICWLIAIIDSYRAGRIRDRVDALLSKEQERQAP